MAMLINLCIPIVKFILFMLIQLKKRLSNKADEKVLKEGKKVKAKSLQAYVEANTGGEFVI